MSCNPYTKLPITPVILCGGSGERLWPLSRSKFPKQFLPLINNSSMLQNTLERIPVEHKKTILICNEDHRFVVAEHIKQSSCGSTTIILEPQRKNTAPAVALAALHAIQTKQDPILLILAADHVINNISTFHQVIRNAAESAEKGKLVTLGIIPRYAETAYGYIKQGKERNDGTYNVAKFVEKPNADTAQAYLDSGEFLWNSGMFLFKASRYIEELKKYRPDILTACKNAMSKVEKDLDFIRPERNAFLKCENESIDYAVMEKTNDCVVVPFDSGWKDVGSYPSLWSVCEKDSQKNVIKGDVIAHRTFDSYIHSENKLIATLGVNNLLVIDTPDALLVADKSSIHDITKIVDELKDKNRPELNFHREVYRPWGKYNLIDSGEKFQVKRITVNPGAKLSLQFHQYRAEHWIVVSGQAKVTLEGKTTWLNENQSTYIPIGATHSLENPGDLCLEMIEIQSGSYLGEDDIIRLEDSYGRDTL